MNKFSKELKHILKEMCKRVNAKYSDIDFKSEDWYTKYSWTFEEQDDFRKWLSDYMYKGDGKKSLDCRKTRKNANIAADMFILSHGWKISDIIHS